MKKLTYLSVIALLLFGLTACSEKDNNHNNDLLGYKLDQFISAADVRAVVDPTAAETDDFRSLFAYEIVSAEDGFSPRQSTNAGYDLPFETFSAGYLVPDDEGRTYFPDNDLPGAFRVTDTGTFRLYRKVDVNVGVLSSKMIELNGLIKYPQTNWNSGTEDGIKLSDLLQGVASYDSVMFFASDGYTKTYLPAQINDGYYLLDSEITTFPTLNPGMTNGMKKFKKLATLRVFGAPAAQVWDFDLALTETADITFEVPSDLSGFESTVLTDE